MPDENTVEVTLDNISVADLFSTLDLNESEVMYEISGFVVEDFVAADPRAGDGAEDLRNDRVEYMLRSPRFKRACLTVLTMRKNPSFTRAEVEEAVGKVNMVQVLIAMFGDEQEDPTTDSQTPPESGTDTRTPSTRSASGSPSTNGSDELDNDPPDTGTSLSDTSSPVSLAAI